jgi:hypothetical protein
MSRASLDRAALGFRPQMGRIPRGGSSGCSSSPNLRNRSLSFRVKLDGDALGYKIFPNHIRQGRRLAVFAAAP